MNNTNFAARINKTAFSAFAIACALTGIATLTPATAEAQITVVGGGNIGLTPPFQFDQSRPRLVVLMHGVTQKPDEAPEIGIGDVAHAKYYWGFDYVKGAQGRAQETATRMIIPYKNGSMQFKTVLRQDWRSDHYPIDKNQLAPIYSPISWNNLLPSGIEWNQQLIKEHINIMTKAGADSTMVMISTRDGSKHLMPQTAEAIDEIYTSYRAAFAHLPEKQQPMLYLVGHSFGGVVARTILANPTAPDLFGNKLSATQRTRADYLRERVVLVHTLSAPHEGTPMGKIAARGADWMSTTGANLIAVYCAAISVLPWNGHSPTWVKQQYEKMLKTAMDAISGRRDCLEDLTRMPEYNAGILHPNTARRSAGGDLVPIYTAAGRNPGGKFYDVSRSVFGLSGTANYHPISTMDIATSGYTRFGKEAMALGIIEGIIRSNGYGKATGAPWGRATLPAGDRVRSPLMGQGAPVRSMDAPFSLSAGIVADLAGNFFGGAPYRENTPDGEWDSDGFLAFDSGHGLNINGSNWFRVFDETKYGGMMPWDSDNHGSMMWNVGNGLWLHNELIRFAGPKILSNGHRRSVWGSTDVPLNPKNGIRVDLVELHDVDDTIDYWSQADFSLKLRIGSQSEIFHGANDVRTVTNLGSKSITNYPSHVIPIKIEVMERDLPYDDDDICMLTNEDLRTSLFVYYDTRTNRVFGDVNGEGGTVLSTMPESNTFSNRVRLKFKVTKIQ